MTIISIDPSGSFNEGKGHTGMAILEDDVLKVFSFSAKDYETRQKYWTEMISVVEKYHADVVVIESFVVRNNGFLVGKMPETPMFIGALVWALGCHLQDTKIVFQSPSQAKTRFKDEYLGRYIPNYEIKNTARGKLYYWNGHLINDHQRDAIKHLLYYKKYNKRED